MLKVDERTLAINFRTAAEKFKLIQDEDSTPIIVRYHGLDGQDKTVDGLLGALRSKSDGPKRGLMRKLQRYTVTVHSREAMKLLSQGDIEEAIPGLYAQVSDWLYHPDLGLNPDGLPPKLTNCIT